MYQVCRTVVSVDGKLTDYVSVKVDVPQGSALSSLMEFLYADDRMGKYKRSKKALEEEVLKVIYCMVRKPMFEC